jgi:signal transduction histidine kinase/CheY-like chemotaxis protein
MRRRVGIRWVVAALVLAVVTPLTILGAFGIQRSWRRLRSNLDRQNIATVRAISVAVDQEVQGTTAALNVLGELHALDSPDLAAFESLASRLLPYQPSWSAILMSDVRGTILDGIPDRADGGALVGREPWVKATVSRNASTVSNLFQLPGSAVHQLMVAVPIVRDGQVVRVLAARVNSAAFSALLHRQQTMPSGAVALIDATGIIVGRTRDEATGVGTRVLPAFAELTARSNEAAARLEVRDGSENYVAFSRSPRTGLVVGMGISASEVDGPITRLMWILSAVWVLIIGTGAGLGFLFGGVIVRALSGASQAAFALSRDEDVVAAGSRIAEIDDLATGLRGAAETLRARNRERDEAARLKDEFLMTISHELRTPLTAIVGWARMLSTGQIKEDQRPGAVAAIERNANALHQLVNDLLDVSRIVSGKLRLDMQAVALPAIVSAALDTIRPAAEAKQVTIATRVDAEPPVRGDAGRLQQIVWNLLSNAIRFTPPGGRIDVTVARVGDSAEISVRDTGSGISSEFLPYVFDRFRQEVTGTKRSHGGLGLGLAIVRHLTELHGGDATAENNAPPPGATFRIRLPIDASAARRGSDVRIEAPELPAVRLDNVRLVVVDDDAHARELCATILANAGARVRTAASVDDALALIAAEWPDVLVSDIEMPNQDGYALLRQVQAMRDGQALAAVAVTAHARPDDQVRALDGGFAWHLAKPFEPIELVNVVAMVTEQRASSSGN